MWKTILGEFSKTVFLEMVQVVVALLLVVILLFAGLLFSHIVKVAAIRVLKTLRFDELVSRTPLAGILERAGIGYSLSEITGIICYWSGLLVSIGVILNATGLTIATNLIDKIIFYIPNIIIALFILVFGMFGASLLRNTVRTIAVNSGIKKADVLGRTTEVIIVVFVSIMALEQLKINVKILETTIGIMLGSAGLAFAIAFGLGSREIIRKFIMELMEKISTPR